MMKYDFKDEAEKATLKIYDYVGDDGWGGGVTAQNVEEELINANNKPLDVYINSYGGEVFEGFAIYNILNRYNGYVRVIVDGIAASIASVIAQAGDEVIMNKASMMMIHNASGMCYGNAEDMKKVVQALESINDVIRDVYKARTGLDDEKLKALMDNETFMTAKECVEYGFADEISDEDMTAETLTNAVNSLNEMKAEYDKAVKQFNDIEKLNFKAEVQVGGESVDDETTALNKKSHWDWLRKGGIN